VIALFAAAALAGPLHVAAVQPAERDAWALRVRGMVSAGTLRMRRTHADTLLPLRTHTRFAQLHHGVPVIGAEIVVQEEPGRTVSVFGSLYDGIDAAAEPALSPDQALEAASRATGVDLGLARRPAPAVLPHPDGTFRLVYPVRVFTGRDLEVVFVDARTGQVAARRSDLKRQAAPGIGTGVGGDRKKMSVRQAGALFVADDPLRPPSLVTYDLGGDLFKAFAFLNGSLELRASDLAADGDNTWTDAAAVDAHTHAGWTYDYFFRRFGRRGLDDADLRITSLVHPARREDVLLYPDDIVDVFFLNAFYAGGGVMVYGDGLPPDRRVDGLAFDYLAGGLDVVAHELAHGVTEYSSNLVYEGESGALNESFSDMMAAGAEFHFQPPGGGPLQADYLLGEDVIRPSGIRSMADPGRFGHPDHYTRRYTGPLDGGGVHVNSGIPNQAFYLAIEGGTNRTSGLSVQGVGPARREEIEKAMYRAFVFLMPPRAGFATARAATLQSARDLYGAGSAAERALAQAWTAVGVP
jgi:Zn-dependent metalloprotease